MAVYIKGGTQAAEFYSVRVLFMWYGKTGSEQGRTRRGKRDEELTQSIFHPEHKKTRAG